MEETIKELFELRKEIKTIKERDIKPLEERQKELESQVFGFLDEQGLTSTALKGIGTVGINESVVPNVKDWDQVYAYIKDNDAFFLLNRAMNAAAFRETIKMGDVPGVEPFTKKTLSVRKAA